MTLAPLADPLGAVWGVAAFTIATMPARTAGGRSGHAATTAASSGAVGLAEGIRGAKPAPMLPDLLPPDLGIDVFPAENRGCSNPVSPIQADPQAMPAGLSLMQSCRA